MSLPVCVVPRTSICHYQNVEPSETVSTNGVLVRCEESKQSWNLVENPLHAILELGRKYIRLVVNADDLERQHSMVAFLQFSDFVRFVRVECHPSISFCSQRFVANMEVSLRGGQRVTKANQECPNKVGFQSVTM